MKRKIVFLVVVFCVLNVFYAQNTNLVQIVSPDLQNISVSEKWLQGQIQDKLKENLQDYAKFTTVVDDSNETKLKELQKKSESAAYDEKTAIEIGQLTSASSAVFSTVRKAGSVYTVSINYINLKTGVHETVNSKGRKNTDDLFDTAGCAVDELTLKLCEKLKIDLSKTERYILTNGTYNLSVDERISMAEQDIKNYEKKSKDLEKQRKSLSVSTALDAKSMEEKLKAEEALNKEKLLAAERRLKELTAQQQKKSIDSKNEEKRSLEFIKKRDAMEKKAQKKAEEIRKLSMEKENIMGKISVIESKKKALLEIRSSVKEQVSEINAQARSDFKKKADEINSVKFEKAELKDGLPTQAAKDRRSNKIEIERQNILNKANEDIEKVKLSTQEQENSIFYEIHNDYKEIQEKQEVSSFGEELYANYGSYDGDKRVWPIELYFYSNKIFITEEKFDLPYDALTKKAISNINNLSEEEYKNYLNNVDIYESLLNRGIQVFNFTLTYRVKAKSDDNPSEYVFYFDEIKVYDTNKKQLLMTLKPKTKEWEFAVSPSYDIRTEEEILAKNEADRLKAEKQAETQRKREEKQSAEEAERRHKQELAQAERIRKQKITEKRREKRRLYVEGKAQTFKQSRGGGAMTGFYGSFGKGENDGNMFDLNFNIAYTPYFFTYLGGGMFEKPEKIEKISEQDYMWYFDWGFGGNWRPFILPLPPSFYLRTGIGITGIYLDNALYIHENTDSSSSSSPYGSSETATYFLWHTAAGVQVPLTKSIALYGEGHLYFLPDGGTDCSASVGIAFVSYKPLITFEK